MDLNIERKICLLFFSKYLQLVNIFTRFVQKKFSPQGQRKLSLVKNYWCVCCELLLTTEQELLFLCGPALQYLILNYLAQSDSKCCYFPWMGCGLPPQDFVGFPWHFTGTHLNSWVERGMRCGSLVFCSRTHHDASDRIRTSRPRVQSAN